MWFKKVIMVLVLGLLFATSAWAQPSNWAVWVPTHAQYTGSGSGPDAFYSDYVNDHFFCSLWNLAGINQVSWGCCCAGDPGHLVTGDPTAIDHYSLVGDYYDCNGNLLQSGAARFGAWVVRGTGTILTGGIGSQWAPCYVVGVSPAEECRVYANTSIQKRSPTYYSTWPEIPLRNPEQNAGIPRGSPDWIRRKILLSDLRDSAVNLLLRKGRIGAVLV